MKEIKFDGLEVKDKLSAKLIGGWEVIPSKISETGMLFETTNRLKINSHCKLQITYCDKKAILGAKVLSVLWKSTVEKNKRKHTLYQVAVEFKNLKDNEKAFLNTIFEEVLEANIPTIQDRVKGAKIDVKE